MSLSKILALGEQDRVIRGQVERITYHANTQEPVVKNVIRDKVTEDMVDTFNKQFRKPIEKVVNVLNRDGNPIRQTDDQFNELVDVDGNPLYETQKKVFKYRTPEMDLDLEAVDNSQLEPELSDAQKGVKVHEIKNNFKRNTKKRR